MYRMYLVCVPLLNNVVVFLRKFDLLDYVGHSVVNMLFATSQNPRAFLLVTEIAWNIVDAKILSLNF